jgi:hypothetical protein
LLGLALALVGCSAGDGGDAKSSRLGAAPSVCTDGDPTQQRHGATCLCCHAELGVAGSIDPTGPPVATVIVTDATGQVATMSPNAFGNFFRHFDLTPPLAARVVGPSGDELRMQSQAPSGDCNACHATGASASPIQGP